MANGSVIQPPGPAQGRPPTSGLFSGLILIVFGFLLLLHNYGHLQIGGLIRHWWPLIFIFWGTTKVYERTIAQREGRSAGWITPGEVFLVIGLMVVVGGVIAAERIPDWFRDVDINVGEPYSYPIDLDPQKIPTNARITIRGGRGTITVRSSDEAVLRVTGQKSIRSFSESEAQKRAKSIDIQEVKVGDGYEIHPAGFDSGDSQITVDMHVVVPKKAVVMVHAARGDVNVSDMASDVTVSTQNGDVEINNTTGNVDASLQKGDVKISDTKGDVKISGHGGEIEVVDASGSLTVDGEFYSSIRADKIAKGVRFVSQRTDLTLSQLGGHLEKTSGNLEIADAPGNLTSRTKNVSVSLENVTGKIVLDNTNGSIELRYSNPPKEDITVVNERASITLSIPSSSSFQIQADCHSCDIDSEFSGSSLDSSHAGNGDAHLEGKYGTGRGPKIVLKSSYDSIAIRKTT
jgi:hypothetical protein